MDNITFTAFFDDIKSVESYSVHSNLEFIAYLNSSNQPGEQSTWTIQGSDSNGNCLFNNKVIWHEHIKSFKVVKKLLENNKISYRHIDEQKLQLSIEINFLDDIDMINIFLYKQKQSINSVSLKATKSCEGSVYFSFQRCQVTGYVKYTLEINPKEPNRKKEFESLFFNFAKWQNKVYGKFQYHDNKIETSKNIYQLIDIFVKNPNDYGITYLPICGIYSENIECLKKFVDVSKQCQNYISKNDYEKRFFFAHYSFPFSYCKEDELDKTMRNLYLKKIDRMYYNIFTGETIKENQYYLWDV